jgi:uncharacterized protein YbbC (DUF1343 family)
MKTRIVLYFLILIPRFFYGAVAVGADVFFQEGHDQLLQGKNVGLVTNHTGVNKDLALTSELFKNRCFKLKALFSPEHGLQGLAYAAEKVQSAQTALGIPIYSLHGETRRPTEEMLKGLDTIVYDIQDIGVRAYTYATTLYYVMEEAAKRNIEVIVLDRPNPMGGVVVDGPMLEESFRSYIGYINVPYCHGMTIGELARFFNEEYQLQCRLKVIPMKGWKRSMIFTQTGLNWIPPSPHVPEADTPFFSASTGILGEMELVNIGIGYTLPFKVVGAPWINADVFAATLNKQNLPGVTFAPFHYRPFYGSSKGIDCHGVLIVINDPLKYKPLSVQFCLLGMIKSLYPKEFEKKLASITPEKRRLFCLASGGDKIFSILEKEKYITWKLLEYDKDNRAAFLKKRQKYLRIEYEG